MTMNVTEQIAARALHDLFVPAIKVIFDADENESDVEEGGPGRQEILVRVSRKLLEQGLSSSEATYAAMALMTMLEAVLARFEIDRLESALKIIKREREKLCQLMGMD